MDHTTKLCDDQPKAVAPLTESQRAEVLDALECTGDTFLLAALFMSWPTICSQGRWAPVAPMLAEYCDRTAGACEADGNAHAANAYRTVAADARAMLATLPPDEEEDAAAIRRADYLADVESDRKAEERAERAKGGAR